MTTEDGIDVDKLTSDAFDAIDTLFSDDDDDNDESFFGGNEQTQKEDQDPISDIDRVREFMLAMEWEYSESEITEFDAFLNEMIPQYPDRYNQDTLKMMSSIVRYIIKAKSNTVPETFYVLDKLAKTFASINQPDLDESTVQHEVRSVYQKVLALKNKISGKSGASYHLDRDGGRSSSSVTDSGGKSTSALAADTLQRDEMLSDLMKRLVQCEKKLAILGTQIENQNTHFEEKSGIISILNGLEERMDTLERTSAALSLGAAASTSIETSKRSGADGVGVSDAEFDLGDELSTAFEIAEDENLELDVKGADTSTSMVSGEGTLGEVSPEEVSFDDLDLSEDVFFEEADMDTPSDAAAFDEVSPDDVVFDTLFDDEIDNTQRPLEEGDAVVLDSAPEYDGDLSGDLFISSPSGEGPDVQEINDLDDEDAYTLHADDIEYDELTMDDIFYDESAHETSDAAETIEDDSESDGQPLTPDHPGAIAGEHDGETDEETPAMEKGREFSGTGSVE